MTSSPSSFVWYELMTTDLDGAEAFYGAVNGWEVTRPNPAWDYRIGSVGGAMVAGLMALPEPARAAGGRPGWTGYIHAADVDAATETLRQAGGAVHREPDDIPGVGRFAGVADPQGAMFQLFKPTGSDGRAQMTRAPGHVGWHELYATDWHTALDFYSGQFGWAKADAVEMGPMGTYQLFSAGAEPIGGMMNKLPEMPVPAWQFYFHVDDIQAGAARVRDNGGQVLMEPHEVPTGGTWIVQCADPQGAMFALMHTTGPAA